MSDDAGAVAPLVLAIDTSARSRLTCVLASAGRLLRGASTEVAPTMTQRGLSAALWRLLPAPVDAVVCVLGPGSYTGIRAGIAAALGVAHTTGSPLHGAGSLEVVARAAGPGPEPRVTAVAAAGRGGAYVAGFELDELGRPTACDEPRRVRVDELPALASGVVAVLEVRLARALGAAAAGRVVVATDPAALLASTAEAALRRPALDAREIRPLYLAPPV